MCRGVASWFPRHSDNLGGERTRGKPIRGEGEVRDGKQAEGGDVEVIFLCVCVVLHASNTVEKQPLQNSVSFRTQIENVFTSLCLRFKLQQL